MRPVNLIPPEDRRGEAAPTRAGGLAYLLIAALAAVLLAVIGVVHFDNKVKDREGRATALEAESVALEARASSLTPFVTLQGVRDARVATVDSLARSRFGWERVLRELSLVVPQGIWLTSLTGSVSPAVETSGEGGGSELRSAAPGPAIELVGCARSHSDVARLVAAMEDIDGVTRATATTSAKGGGGSAEGDGCQTRPSVSAFSLIAAFDEVAISIGASPAPVAPATGEAVPAAASSQAEVAEAGQDVQAATDVVPGG